jgi:hypothetical protein
VVKKILINACSQCPHYKISLKTRIPICDMLNKPIPFTLNKTKGFCIPEVDEIPEWCVLDDDY